MAGLSVLRERLRSRLWPVPALAAVVAVAGALALSRVGSGGGWVSDPEAARGLLQVLAGSSLTVVALVFSLHVVALQLAASQYSPRLLRTYSRDWVIQAALAVLIGTFAFCLVTLATFGDGDGSAGPSVTVAVLLGLACVGALVGVVSHIVTSLRVETMMAGLHADAEAVITDWVGHRRDGGDGLSMAVGTRAPSARLTAQRSGFVQAVDAPGLAAWAGRAGAHVRVDVVPGEHVLAGEPVARVWGVEQQAVADSGPAGALLVGFERTPDQDPALGLVQLVDIALRALSPSLNDPTTAVHALGHVTSLLVDVAAQPEGADLVTDGPDGLTRVWQASRSLTDFLAITCHPLARAAQGEPDVLCALVRTLAAVGQQAGPAGTAPIRAELAHLERCAQRGLADEDDRRRVEEAVADARVSLGS